jgi:hypothetical protein
VGVGLDVDELGRDPQGRSGSADAAFQGVADIQLAPDAPEIPVRGLELHRRGSGDHGQCPDSGEVGDHLLHEAIGEVRVVGIRTEVRERQDDDRLFRGRRRRIRGIQAGQELRHRAVAVSGGLGQRPLDGSAD